MENCQKREEIQSGLKRGKCNSLREIFYYRKMPHKRCKNLGIYHIFDKRNKVTILPSVSPYLHSLFFLDFPLPS